VVSFLKCSFLLCFWLIHKCAFIFLIMWLCIMQVHEVYVKLVTKSEGAVKETCIFSFSFTPAHCATRNRMQYVFRLSCQVSIASWLLTEKKITNFSENGFIWPVRGSIASIVAWWATRYANVSDLNNAVWIQKGVFCTLSNILLMFRLSKSNFCAYPFCPAVVQRMAN